MPGPRKTLDVPSGHRRDRQPLGEPTRGKTATNRLRRLDLWLLRTEPALVAAAGAAPFVDLGYGRLPYTTAESARALRRLNPHLPVLGVEVDRERVEAAAPWSDALTTFRRGGFELPLRGQARVIRAMNVLRQYEEDAAREAWRLLGDRLLPGGLLIEGTSTPFGRLLVVQLLRREGDALTDAGLLFSTNFRTPEPPRPEAFRAVLPKHLIHRMVPGTRIHRLMASWEAAWERARVVESFGRRQVFVRAAEELAESGVAVRLDRWLLRRGFLCVDGILGED